MTENIRRKAIVFIPILICFISIAVLTAFAQHKYRQTANEHISKFSQILIENNPDAKQMVLTSLKEYAANPNPEFKDNSFLTQYGYGHSEFDSDILWSISVLSLGAILIIGISFLISVHYLNKHNLLRINELTAYLEQVNTGVPGTVVQAKEDSFSHLQDEMYKTVTFLFQTRESAVKARISFADNLSNIAHQLKTPLTAAFLSLQLMKKDSPNAYALQIQKQLERLNRLEEALLTLSKNDAGTLYLDDSPVDIYTALNLASENLSELLEKENITVVIPDKGCIEIRGDLEWTMEALMNLLKNCMEHSPKAGTIHCDYSSNPLYAQILIWDEGNGFEPSDIPHLFERFYRGKNAEINGIGIGLALSQSIFALQNGTLTARNLPEGGACFEIRVYKNVVSH